MRYHKRHTIHNSATKKKCKGSVLATVMHAMHTLDNRNHQRPSCENNASLKDFANILEPHLFPVVPRDLQLLPNLLGHTHRQCCYCNTKGKDERGLKPINVDEILPCGQGVRYNAVNRVPACGDCNSSKGARAGTGLRDWMQRRVEAGLMSVDHMRTLETYIQANMKYVFSQIILDRHPEVACIVRQAIQWKLHAIACVANQAVATTTPPDPQPEGTQKRPREDSA